MKKSIILKLVPMGMALISFIGGWSWGVGRITFYSSLALLLTTAKAVVKEVVSSLELDTPRFIRVVKAAQKAAKDEIEK